MIRRIAPLLTIVVFGINASIAQIGISTDGSSPDASAVLDVNSSARGILVPRMLKTQRNAIASPATGLLIFQTNAEPGFYYYNGVSWVALLGAGSTSIGGLSDGKTGNNCVFLGQGSGSLNTGSSNMGAGASALLSNSTGIQNTGIGGAALILNSTGDANTAVGVSAIASNLSGHRNTAIGAASLATNTNGSGNIAIGFQAGLNETGSNKLYIDNSSSTTPLIYGEFDENKVTINDIMNIAPRSTAPIAPLEGDLYYDSGLHKLRVWNGSSWEDLN